MTEMPKTLYVLSSVRTNNFNDAEIMAKISGAWSLAMAEPIEGAVYYGVYHHYERDYEGDYDVSVAVDVPGRSSEVLQVPAQHYVYFEVDASNPQGVIEMWQHIWQQPLGRAYLFDFEEYFADGRIRIAIGIKQ